MARGKASISGRIVCGVMAFLLSVLLTVAVLLPVLYFTLMSSGAFTRAFKSAGYYQSLQQYCVDQARAALIPTGFPEEVLDGVLTEEDVQTIVDGQIMGTFAKEDMAVVVAGMQDRMLENMYAYMDANDIPRDIVSADALDNIANTVISDFESLASFPLVNRLRSYFSLYSKLVVIGVIVCVGISVFLCKMIHSLSIWKHVYLRNLAFSVGGTAAMLLALPAGILIWGGYKRIGIANGYMFDFVQKIISNTLWAFVACGLVALAATVILAIVSEKGRKNARHHRRRRDNRDTLAEGLPEI